MNNGINIYSGSGDFLGAALTNPTALAVKKSRLERGFPVSFNGKTFPDVETAYHVLGTESAQANDRLMAELICAKFVQHPQLLAEVDGRGGRAFLENCSHFTGAKTARFQSWEGHGMASRFIRNLVQGYELAKTGENTEQGQFGLF